MDDLILYLKSAIFSIPFLLIQSIGVILAVVYRSRLPRGWGAAATGFFLLVVGNISWLIYYALFVWVFRKNQDYETLEVVMMVQSVFQSITGFIGYALLLIALLRRREI